MTDISRHPLIKQAFDVCQAIEACGASVELTNAVGKASDLMRAIDAYIPVKAGPYDFDPGHNMSDDSKLGGQICINCGAMPGTQKAVRTCKYAEGEA